MGKLHLLISAALLITLQVNSESLPDSGVSRNKIPIGIHKLVTSKVKEKKIDVNSFYLSPRSEPVQPNKEIIEKISKRGYLTSVNVREKKVFFAFGDAKVTNFNGKNKNTVSIDDVRQIHHTFLISQENVNCLPDDNLKNQIAHEWWRKNQAINYMPLRVSLVNYLKIERDSAEDKDNQTFFAVTPIFNSASSQLIVFGFEKDFFFTNTRAAVKTISIEINGEKYQISRHGQIEVGFPDKGNYLIPVSVTMNDGSVFTSAFNFLIQPLADGTWTNSKIDQVGNLDFIY